MKRPATAIVTVHPGGGVKEQVADLNARRLAERGFVTLAFDTSHQGASGGTPRFLDMPMLRVDDVSSAVDKLTTLPFVDKGAAQSLLPLVGEGGPRVARVG